MSGASVHPAKGKPWIVRLSPPDSRASVWIIPTNEEPMITQHTLALIKA